MTLKGALIGLLAPVAALLASNAFAQGGAACTISTTSVNFGSYNVFNGSALDSTGTITYNCNAAAKNISVSLSKGASSTYSPRTMTKGGELLGYNLFRDAARTTIWGDGTSGTSVYLDASPPKDTNVNVTVYGQVSPGQDVSAGAFSDTISATINF